MEFLNYRQCVFLVFSLIVMNGMLRAQCNPPQSRAFVIVSDAGSGSDTLWFGHDPTATSDIDSHLCEIELPPIPPAGVFDTRFVWRTPWGPPPGHQGLLEDYRATSIADTHIVKFQSGDAGFPFTFRWLVSAIVSMCDSALLIDEFGGIVFVARMHVTDSLTIQSPAFSTLRLIRYGPYPLPQDVTPDKSPKGFRLLQNYPNPFNPKTIINYQQSTNNWVTLKVFDVLGREVATLVNEVKEPGAHSVEWDASGQPSGMYFYRLSAGPSVTTKKALLVK